LALEVCDDGVPDGLTAIDLSLKNTEITGNNPDYVVSYYETLSDAEAGINVLPTLYTNTSNPQTIYVRVEDIGTGCYATTLLDLVVQQAPVANIPAPFTYCDPDNDGFGEFVLTDLDNEITGGVAGVSVSYHDTFANADTNAAAIDTSIPYSNIVINTQVVYARVESTTIATNCASIVPVELIVYPSPEVPAILSDYLLCDDNNDGILQFDLNTKASEILGTQDPTALVLSYHVSASDAQTGNNPIINTGNYTNTSNPQVIYVRLFNPLTGCQDTGLFNIEVILPPVAVQATPLEQCDDLGEVGDQVTVFDLTEKDTEITGGNGSWSVAYYETDADAQAQANAIADPTQYTNTSVNGLPANPQTLYAVVTDTDTGCIDITTLTIRVLPNPSPTPSALLPDLELCDANNIGDGQEDFDLTQNELLILNGETGVTASYYETESDAHAGINPIPDPTVYTNIQSPEQIHVRVTNDLTGCYTLVDFTIRVNPLPEVVAVTDFIQCELNTDGFDSFDLTTKTAEVLAGQDPSLFVVSYHESLADAQAVINGLVSPYINQSNPQQIFVAITNTVTGCSIATQTFTIEVQEAAEANPDMAPIVYEVCDDDMETDGDPSNDSVQFDLATQDADILDGQDPSNYIVSYYATEEAANLNVNPLPLLYENLSNPQVIYARVDNNTPDGATGLDSSICYAVTPLTLQVNPLPVFSLEQGYTLCINSNGTEVINPPVIETGLSEQDYSFEWRFNGEVLPLETSSSLVPNQAGSYQVIVTHTNTGCVNDTEVGITEVIESDPPSLELNLVTQAFAENHVIEAIATGNGDYEYSLDGGPWQDSTIFTDVSPGIRVITARDKNGCGLAEAELLVIDYPLYFTPNGDGTNDTWNIVGIDTQPNAKIYIFDRYGKSLKQLSPLGNGWNGTFNGNAMPSSDYWFTVDYNEPSTGDRKTFNAHFTLKR
jgi:gliding motility-associated-like protein